MRLTKKLKLSSEELEIEKSLGDGQWASLGKKEIKRAVAMAKKIVKSPKTSVPWEALAAEKIRKYSEPGLALRGARVKEGMTKAELSKKVGVSQDKISKMEAGKLPVELTTAKKLAKLLRIDYRVFVKQTSKPLEDMPIGKLTKIDLNIPKKPDFGDSSKVKISPSAKCIFREIGHSESEAFSLRFRSKLIFNLRENLKDATLSKTYRLKKLDLKKQDFKNVSNGKISKLSLDTLLYMFCVLGGTIDLNPPKPLQLKKLRGIMKKAQSQFSKKRVPKRAIKETIAESRKARSEDSTLGEMLVTAMEEAVQIAENPNDFPKRFRIVKDFLPSPTVLLKSTSAKPRKNNKKK